MQSEATRHHAGDSPGTRHHDDGIASALVFRDDVRVVFDGESVDLTSPVTSLTLRPVRNGIRAALCRLAAGPTRLPDLLDGLLPAECEQLYRFFDRAGLLIARSILLGPQELLRIEHTVREIDHRAVDVSADTRVRLSRFALCRTRADTLVLESPLATLRVLLVHPAARRLVAALGSVRAAAELTDDDLSVADVCHLLGFLAGVGLVDVGDSSGTFAPDEDPTLRQWDFHDLLLHSRIRSGRYDDVFGAVYPYAGEIDAQPAVKPAPDGSTVELYRPSWDDLAANDPGLTAVLEARRSIRAYGEQPLTVEQLGEFLYRVGRVRAHYVPAEGDGDGDELVSRPYPSGGGAYELELYLSVRRCAGLDQGIYYYDPVGHRLILVNDDTVDRESMFNVAGRATGVEARPDVLITVTSRFQRLSWKYRGIAYATTLRHTGVLYQTMYLVATAMGLAACGLGNGDADMAARVLRLDYLKESSVGDFILGSRPADDGIAGRPAAGWRLLNSPEWALKAISG
jgi:SagB-type dehydrogenase family enzyme